MEQESSNIMKTSTSTCEEVLEKVKRERKVWMSEDTWTVVEERRKLKANLEAARTRQPLAATNMYNEEKLQERPEEN